MLIGLGEGLISALVLVAMDRTRPDLLRRNDAIRLTTEHTEYTEAGDKGPCAWQASEKPDGVKQGLPPAVLPPFFRVVRVFRGSTKSYQPSPPPGRVRLDWHWVAFSLLVILGFALFVAPFACPWPDGLESVATKLGIKPDSMQSHVPAPAPDYAMPGIEWPVGATALAGGVGALIVFALAWWLGHILVPRPSAQPSTPPLSS